MFHSQYLHPDNWTEENLNLVSQMAVNAPHQMQLPNPLFDKESLESLPEHKWMKTKKMTLVTQEEYPDLIKDLLPVFEASLMDIRGSKEDKYDESEKTVGYLGIPLKYLEEHKPHLIALDLETTGLNKTIRIIGGSPQVPSIIVGICISPNPDEGYYIPVFHNQKDGVKNYGYEHAKDFLKELQDPRFVCIYHNAQFDREILETNNIPVCREYVDTQILLDNMNYKDLYFTVALKVLAAKVLHRKMLEIKDLSGTKTYIPLQYYPARSFTVYGCSDAMNTYGLIRHVLQSPLNPFLVNNFAMRLDWRTNDFTRWMLRPGMPIDHPHLKKTIRTTMRRRQLVIDYFKTNVTDSLEIGSAEQIGQFLGVILKKYFEENHPHKDTLSDEEIFEDFQGRMKELFHCDVKVKELKTRVKVTYSSGTEVLEAFKNIQKRKSKAPWLPEKLFPLFIAAAECVDIYRSVVHDLGVLASMYRYAYTDDINIHRISVGLKFNGTITNRYSNAKGSGSLARFVISRGKRKISLKYAEADDTAGLNLQGVNSDPILLTKAYKVVGAPEEFLDKKQLLDEEVDYRLFTYLEQM